MRFLPVLEGLGFPASRQRVVLNRNHRRFMGDLSTADIEGRLGRPLDHVVPYDSHVLVSMNTGKPYALHAPRWSRFARAIKGLVASVEQPSTPSSIATDGVAQRGAIEPEIVR
jgi:MinD-like ATPase involved in chromosome partitioning or flagellar assembly